MLLSCHSFNSGDDEYVGGCSGYARDNFSFIVFTATNPDNPSTLNNRKNSRQIFAYRPGNGLLLQSRLYNTCGGTVGAQEDSTLYRDLVQRELSDLEDAVNLWKTYDYVGNNLCGILAGIGFSGYQDWTYKEFAAKISLRSDHKEDFVPFTMGTSGLCVCCGSETGKGIYCRSCNDEDENCRCDSCGDECGDLNSVHDHNDRIIYVCDDCQHDYYTRCAECDAYYPDERMTETGDGDYVCQSCLAEHYTPCKHCGTYYRTENVENGHCSICRSLGRDAA